MFDFAWTEIALIGVVALIAIGPKDLPVAIKTVAGFIKKARKMAGEFQGHVDEMVREANLHEVRDQINQLKNFDIKGEIEKHIDSDGALRATFNENPMAPHTGYSAPVVEVAAEPVAPPPAPAPQIAAPSFIPPTSDIVAPQGPSPLPPSPPPPSAPAFVPPGSVAPASVAPAFVAEAHEADIPGPTRAG